MLLVLVSPFPFPHLSVQCMLRWWPSPLRRRVDAPNPFQISFLDTTQLILPHIGCLAGFTRPLSVAFSLFRSTVITGRTQKVVGRLVSAAAGVPSAAAVAFASWM